MAVPDEAEKTIESESAKTLFQLAMDILKWGKHKVADSVQLIEASQQYLRIYSERHCQIKVLGMSQPMYLRNLYTAVQVVEPKYLKAFGNPEELQKSFRRSKTRGFGRHKAVKRDGLSVAKDQQFLSVLGQPGAGKSTFLKRVGLEALSGKSETFPHKCVPVFIELKTAKFKELNLLELISSEFKTCGFPDKFAQTALRKGAVLILLDGLDEVPANKVDHVIRHIRDFVDKHKENRFIISCRTAFYRSWFTRFTDVILADFDDDQIREFIANWFSSEQDVKNETGKELWHLLQQPEYISTLELARTPLLLTFLCLFTDASQRLPANRSDLYEEALKILLEKWAAEKRITHGTGYKALTTKLEILMLEQIAGPWFGEDKLFFTKKELVRKIDSFLEKEINAPIELDGEQLLEAIEIQQGLFTQRAHDIYSFSHLTLQEYLAARHFYNSNTISTLIKEHLFDERWREVFLLFAGMGQADNLLFRMVDQLSGALKTNKNVSDLIRWAQQNVITCKDVNQQASNRATAIFFALTLALTRDLRFAFAIARQSVSLNEHFPLTERELASDVGRAYAIARDISVVLKDSKYQLEFDFELDREMTDQILVDLQKVQIFPDVLLQRAIDTVRKLRSQLSMSEKTELGLSYTQQVRLGILEALGLGQSIHNWSSSEIRPMVKILYGTHLLVESKNAALSVSFCTWDQIARRLLTVESAFAI